MTYNALKEVCQFLIKTIDKASARDLSDREEYFSTEAKEEEISEDGLFLLDFIFDIFFVKAEKAHDIIESELNDYRDYTDKKDRSAKDFRKCCKINIDEYFSEDVQVKAWLVRILESKNWDLVLK